MQIQRFTYFAPRWTPTVFDNPVVNATLSAITNNKYSMIIVIWITGFADINAARIVCESPLRRIDCYSNGSILGNGLLNSFLISIVNILVTSNFVSSRVDVWITIAISCFVWNIAERDEAFRGCIVEGI